jgi:protein-tyrosine phosphatase
MNRSDTDRVAVLFVCLGNICRSPLAEGVFRHLVQERGLDGRFRIESAGTGAWHVGEPPDRRAAEVARRHEVSLEGQCARQVRPSDFHDFDYVIAMDRDNLRELNRLRAAGGTGDGPGDATLLLLRDHDPEGGGDVPDPYFGGDEGFDRVFAMVRRSAEALLDHLGG